MSRQSARSDASPPRLLNLGCGEDYRDTWHNVDQPGAEVHANEYHDLNVFPWPFPDNHFIRIHASHVLEHLDDLERVLRECERILVPDGELEIRWPIGMNERADPDHKHVWVWDTPLFYCGERHWDVDVGLEVASREVYLHSHFQGVVNYLYEFCIKVCELQYGQGRWMFDLPATSGEFRVVMSK